MSLVDAYVRLGCAQGDYLIQQSKLTATTTTAVTDSPTTSPTSTSAPDFITAADLNNTFTEVQKFVEASDTKVLSLSVTQAGWIVTVLPCNNHVNLETVLFISQSFGIRLNVS